MKSTELSLAVFAVAVVHMADNRWAVVITPAVDNTRVVVMTPVVDNARVAAAALAVGILAAPKFPS